MTVVLLTLGVLVRLDAVRHGGAYFWQALPEAPAAGTTVEKP